MCGFWTYLFSCLLVLMIASFNGTAVRAQDIVKVMLKQSAIDQRGDYKFDLIKLILEASRDRFGSYEFIFNQKMKRKRA